MAHHQRIHLGDADSLAVVRRHSPILTIRKFRSSAPHSLLLGILIGLTIGFVVGVGLSFGSGKSPPSQCPLPESHAKVIPRLTSNMSQSALIAPAFAPNSAVALVETDEEECCKPADQHKLPEPKEIHLNSFWREPFHLDSFVRDVLGLIHSRSER